MENRNFHYAYRILMGILLVEYLIIQLSGVGLHALVGNPLFSLPADPVSWLPFLAAIPGILLWNLTGAWFFDIFLLLILVALFLNPLRQLPGIVGCILSFLFFVTMMSRHIHWNFQEGMFIVLFPLVFKKIRSKLFAFEAIRYFLLFFYGSAGLLKLLSGSYLNSQHLSHLLTGQFGPYFLEGNTGWRTSVHLFLVNHSGISYFLFLGSIVLELFAFVGFFTRRFDPFIALSLLLFHLADWVIMDIAPFGQLAFICLLFFSRSLLRNSSTAGDFAIRNA